MSADEQIGESIGETIFSIVMNLSEGKLKWIKVLEKRPNYGTGSKRVKQLGLGLWMW